MSNHPFTPGSKVKLRDDVLQRHARSVPAHMGYTREQFQWRDTLRKLKGKTGIWLLSWLLHDNSSIN